MLSVNIINFTLIEFYLKFVQIYRHYIDIRKIKIFYGQRLFVEEQIHVSHLFVRASNMIRFSECRMVWINIG